MGSHFCVVAQLTVLLIIFQFCYNRRTYESSQKSTNGNTRSPTPIAQNPNKPLASALASITLLCHTRGSELLNNTAFQQSFPTARTSACCETAPRAPLKNKALLSQSANMRSRRARARCATHLPRAAEQPPSITYRYPAGTHERTSPTALAIISQHGRRPVTTTTSASPQLMTTKHERRTSPR